MLFAKRRSSVLLPLLAKWLTCAKIFIALFIIVLFHVLSHNSLFCISVYIDNLLLVLPFLGTGSLSLD